MLLCNSNKRTKRIKEFQRITKEINSYCERETRPIAKITSTPQNTKTSPIRKTQPPQR